MVWLLNVLNVWHFSQNNKNPFGSPFLWPKVFPPSRTSQTDNLSRVSSSIFFTWVLFQVLFQKNFIFFSSFNRKNKISNSALACLRLSREEINENNFFFRKWPFPWLGLLASLWFLCLLNVTHHLETVLALRMNIKWNHLSWKTFPSGDEETTTTRVSRWTTYFCLAIPYTFVIRLDKLRTMSHKVFFPYLWANSWKSSSSRQMSSSAAAKVHTVQVKPHKTFSHNN